MERVSIEEFFAVVHAIGNLTVEKMNVPAGTTYVAWTDELTGNVVGMSAPVSKHFPEGRYMLVSQWVTK